MTRSRLTRHAGEENAMPRAAILTRFNLVRRKPISDRVFREIVSELVTVYKKAICTTPARGYFAAHTVRRRIMRSIISTRY